MDNLIFIGCSMINVLSSVLLKKFKKKEILKSPSKYYYLIISLINLCVLFLPLSPMKKSFAILLIAPLVYQAFMDVETLELSDILSGIVLGYGLLYITLSHQYSNIIPAMVLCSIYTVLSIVGPVGFGDVKLLFGLCLFIENVGTLLFYPFLFAVAIEIFLRIIKRKQWENNVFAFGPYIILSFYFILFYVENPLRIFLKI